MVIWSNCCMAKVSLDEARRIHEALGVWLELQD
jgi:hypothetical protein